MKKRKRKKKKEKRKREKEKKKNRKIENRKIENKRNKKKQKKKKKKKERKKREKKRERKKRKYRRIVVKRVLEEKGITSDHEAIYHEISRMKNKKQNTPSLKKSNSNHQFDGIDLKQIMYEYEKRLKESNTLDFDDLMLCALDLFDKQPRVISEFEHVLVDEVGHFLFRLPSFF